MKKLVLIGLSILLSSGLYLMLTTGREQSGELQMKTRSYIEDIRILQKKNGETLWALTAKRADFMEDQDKAHLSDINMVIKKNNIVLHADKGIYNITERSLSTESVVNAKSENLKITADSIDFEVSSGKILTDGRIEIQGNGFRVEGKGMKAESEQKVSILDDVKATFHK
jgi:LPS export ABC transporter protein LptC